MAAALGPAQSEGMKGSACYDLPNPFWLRKLTSMKAEAPNLLWRMQPVGWDLRSSATFDQSSYLAIRPVCHRRRGIR
jgi:hypothetical protein